MATEGFLQDEIDNVLQIEREDKPKNYFVDRGLIPIGTRRPWDSYTNGIIPKEELVTIKVDKSNVINSLTVAPTGVGKSRFRKRILGYMQLHKYNILAIDPKSTEYLTGGIKMGNGRRLHQYEENSKYDVKCYVPAYVKKHIYEHKRLTKHLKYFSPDMKTFKDTALWRNLGVSDKAANFVVSQIVNKIYSLERISSNIQRARNLMANTKRASVGAISIMEDLGFFDSRFKDLDLKKEWLKKNIVAVSFFAQQGGLMTTIISKLIQQARDIGNSELQSGKKITPKFIDFDDALYYAIFDKMEDFNMAVREIKNAQNNYRSLGISTNVTVQNPSFIHNDIIDGCTLKFVWGIENPESLRGLIPQGAFKMISNRDLIEDESSYTFECIMIKGRRRWETFFPLDVPYGHG